MDNEKVNEGVSQGEELQKVDKTRYELETAQAHEQRMQMLKELENFTNTLNRAPQANKIAKHQGYLYIPISVVEKDLFKQFFGLVQYEVLNYSQVFNEVLVSARIKVFHPVIRQWLNYDGVGSAVIQQDAKTKVSDFHLFKKQNAMQLAFPKAYAEAIKNAAKKIGKRFGSDINRTLEDDYSGYFKDQPKEVDDSQVLNK